MTVGPVHFRYVISHLATGLWVVTMNGVEIGRYRRFSSALDIAKSLATLDKTSRHEAAIEFQDLVEPPSLSAAHDQSRPQGCR